LPLLRQHGHARIIMVTSASIYLTIPLGCSYPVSKHALTALTDHLRMEMAPFGIEVTALEPGVVITPMITGGYAAGTETALWNSIPAPLRQQYEAAFTYPARARGRLQVRVTGNLHKPSASRSAPGDSSRVIRSASGWWYCHSASHPLQTRTGRIFRGCR
jgi:NAD(P)-dependent dehydrogenase (short-subunit alcohol dehydrogenase family)